MAKFKITTQLVRTLKMVDEGRYDEIRLDHRMGLSKKDLMVRNEDTETAQLTSLGASILRKYGEDFARKEQDAVKRTKRAKQSPKERETDFLKARNDELVKKYKHYVGGSVQRARGHSKLRAEIKCVECGAKRAIFTSDLFQVKTCGNHKKNGASKKGKKGRKAK